MSMPSGSIVEDGHEFRATPDVRAPSYSWSLAFLDHKNEVAAQGRPFDLDNPAAVGSLMEAIIWRRGAVHALAQSGANVNAQIERCERKL
jgi:hypothetical protein